MKRATVADLRNNFRRVSALIENGESIDITRRGKIIARITPPIPPRRKLVKPDIMKRLNETWGSRVLSAKEVKELRELEREGDWG